jgi:hypothetical protein
VPGLLPLAWVEPRHEIFRRPSRQRWPFDEAVQALRAGGEAAPGEQLLVYSEDDRLYEGYLALALRERWQGAPVRGLVTDPVGSYELAPQARLLLVAGPPGRGWPAAAQIEEQLREDNYRLEDLPPVAEAVAAMGPCFSEVGRWPAGDVELVGFLRREGCATVQGQPASAEEGPEPGGPKLP